MKRVFLLLLFLAVPRFCSAQTPNCEGMNWTLQGIDRTYGPQNEYIASQTVTYNVTCTYWKNGQPIPALSTTSAVSATGAGGVGWNGSSTVDIACNPQFSVSGYIPTYVGGVTPNDSFTNNGENFGVSLSTGWPSVSSCFFESTNTKQVFCATQACQTTCQPPHCPGSGSPILIDLDGKGFFLTDAQDGVRFDISGTGTPVQIAWTAKGADNAFLSLPGADGLVHNGTQLFGNYSPQPPSDDPNGFAALAVYDEPENGGNGDGILDARDEIWPSLRLWIDKNHDGTCTKDEMFTLDSLGVHSISLAYTKTPRVDQFGNQFRYRAKVNPGDPSDVGRWAYDVFFVVASPIAKCMSPTKSVNPVGDLLGLIAPSIPRP
jgi:hypothetical protein